METPCKTEDDCPTPMWCRGKDRCPKRDAKEQADSPLDAAACSVSSVRERYTSLARAGRKYMPQLEIDHQSFHVWYEYTTKKQAEWVRDQMAVALARMISQNTQDHP